MLTHVKRVDFSSGMSLKARIRRSFSETFQTLFSPLTLFIWLASVVVTSVAGPFGTFATMTGPVRVAYWLAVISASVLVGYSMRALALMLVDRKRPFLLDGMIVVLMTVVFTPVAWQITRLAGAAYPSLQAIAGYVMLCSTVVVVSRRVMPGFEAEGYDFLPEIDPLPSDTAPQPRLLRRLRPDVMGDVLRLTANDHFVEVVTMNGAETLRMRLADAIDEMEPVKGYCVHRSHWVAHQAVKKAERENSHKLFVVLANGDRIPVSRKYRVNVEKAGLI